MGQNEHQNPKESKEKRNPKICWHKKLFVFFCWLVTKLWFFLGKRIIFTGGYKCLAIPFFMMRPDRAFFLTDNNKSPCKTLLDFVHPLLFYRCNYSHIKMSKSLIRLFFSSFFILKDNVHVNVSHMYGACSQSKLIVFFFKFRTRAL